MGAFDALTRELTSAGHVCVRFVRRTPAADSEAFWDPMGAEIDLPVQFHIDPAIEAGCAPVVGVLGARAHQVRARTRCEAPCLLVENAAYRSGRASSLRVGARMVAKGTGAVVVASGAAPRSREPIALFCRPVIIRGCRSRK